MCLFKGFTADTFLGLFSCILGIVALFISGKTYKKCKFLYKSMDDNKEYYDNSDDYSQRAGRDIINNSIDTEVLTQVTTANFESSLQKACSLLEDKAKDNLNKILEKTREIIEEEKIKIAGFNKIDWINIYFENAKNTSDEFMQRIWARVLTKEAEKPGSISYRTLDILRNMSSIEFDKFEDLCSVEINGWIHHEIYNMDCGVDYVSLVKMGENGLINMQGSEMSFEVKAGKTAIYRSKQVDAFLKNTGDKDVIVKFPIYLLTSSAIELESVITVEKNMSYYQKCFDNISKRYETIEVTIRERKNI